MCARVWETSEPRGYYVFGVFFFFCRSSRLPLVVVVVLGDNPLDPFPTSRETASQTGDFYSTFSLGLALVVARACVVATNPPPPSLFFGGHLWFSVASGHVWPSVALVNRFRHVSAPFSCARAKLQPKKDTAPGGTGHVVSNAFFDSGNVARGPFVSRGLPILPVEGQGSAVPAFPAP